MRRGLAALTSAVSLTAGVIAVTAPGAQAAGDVTGGRIALYDGSDGVVTVNADGTDPQTVSGLTDSAGLAPNWAPDGSRLLSGWPGQLMTGRATGDTSRIDLPAPDGGVPGGSWKDATFWLGGHYVVSSTADELYYGPSDGAFASEPLLSGRNQRPSSACDSSPAAAPDGTLAFVRTDPCGGSAGGDIWTYDPASDTSKELISDGSYPSYSGDGATLAFTRVVDGRLQIFTAAADGSDVKQVTTDAVDHRDLSFDPEGGRIAYDEIDPASGSTTAKVLDLSDGSTTTLSTTGSKPAWQPLRQNVLVRVYGTGAIGIDDAASRWTFDTVGGTHVDGLVPAKSAVLVNKTNATYAAPAVSLASEKQAPVLMTSATALDSSAVTELKRSLPKGGTVYLTGGTNLLSSAVESQVKALGYTPLRLGGTDLAGVSARVAKQITATPSWIFLADGTEFHDPVTASTAAAALGYRGTGVVLLTRGTSIPSTVQNYMNALDPEKTNLVSVGTNARKALENTPLQKPWYFWDVSGSSTETTAVNMAHFWWNAPSTALVESTWSWQNAVTGNAASGVYGPALWSTIAELSPGTEAYLDSESSSVQAVQTFGGNDSYSVAERTSISSAIAAGSAWTTTVWVPAGTPQLMSAPKVLAPEALAPKALAKGAPAVSGAAHAPRSVLPGHAVSSRPTHHTAS
ncbi:hypothetical protein Sm713_54280 [Streptomyces sp. TS71-3]|nr:hypothetical protein Sm713_54280 [Streptomyces sp. TS71-3]